MSYDDLTTDDLTTDDLDRAERRYWDDYREAENVDEEDFLSRERALIKACDGQPFYVETDGYAFVLRWDDSAEVFRTFDADRMTDIVDASIDVPGLTRESLETFIALSA